MRTFTIVAIVVLAVSSVSCAKPSGSDTLVSPLAPTQHVTLAAKSGGGKGKNDPTASFALVMVTDINGNGLPDWGDSVKFDVSTTEIWNQVDLTCDQNGVGVFGAVFPWTPIITLSSTAWQGGAADCRAELIAFAGRKIDILASLTFVAGK